MFYAFENRFAFVCERADLGHTTEYWEGMWNWDRLLDFEVSYFMGYMFLL
jgi:hypothetical protein